MQLASAYSSGPEVRKTCVCAPSRNGRLLALVQFEKNDFKAFIVEQPFTYYILVGVHNLPFLLRVHTCV